MSYTNSCRKQDYFLFQATSTPIDHSSCNFAVQDMFHPSKQLVAIKVMNLDYGSLGTQVSWCYYSLHF